MEAQQLESVHRHRHSASTLHDCAHCLLPCSFTLIPLVCFLLHRCLMSTALWPLAQAMEGSHLARLG